jgi:hypothetical protein
MVVGVGVKVCPLFIEREDNERESMALTVVLLFRK